MHTGAADRLCGELSGRQQQAGGICTDAPAGCEEAFGGVSVPDRADDSGSDRECGGRCAGAAGIIVGIGDTYRKRCVIDRLSDRRGGGLRADEHGKCGVSAVGAAVKRGRNKWGK